MHEVASLLGNVIAEQELLPIAIGMLKDNLEVREGIIANLPQLYLVLDSH